MAQKKITFRDLFIFINGKEPGTIEQLTEFIQINDSFKRHQREVPDCYHDTVENFLGFYELMESEMVFEWDENYFYITLKILDNTKKLAVKRNESYLKTREGFYERHKCHVLWVTLGDQYVKEFKEKIEKEQYF